MYDSVADDNAPIFVHENGTVTWKGQTWDGYFREDVDGLFYVYEWVPDRVQSIGGPGEGAYDNTGFEVGTAYTRQGQFEVVGRNGTLTDYWAQGMRTYHGFYSVGFPNCFHMGLTQTGLSPNLTYMLDNQARHIAYIVDEINRRDIKAFEPEPEADPLLKPVVPTGVSRTSTPSECELTSLVVTDRSRRCSASAACPRPSEP